MASYITFDENTRRIEIGADGSITSTTWAEVYSAWKRWVTDSVGSAIEPAFAGAVGGNDLGDGVFLDGYYFLRNDLGWRVTPEDVDGEWVFVGNGFGFNPTLSKYEGRPNRTIGLKEVVSSRALVREVDNGAVDTDKIIGQIWAASPD